MGLDAVELVMEIEESLGVRFPDDQVGRIRTVGDLYEVVLQTRPAPEANSNICLSAATFRLIRRTIQPDVAIESRRLRPRDALEPVLPRDNRRATWSRWQTLNELRFPELVRPKWLVALAAIVTLASALACGYLVYARATFGTAVLAGLLAVTVLTLLLVWATTPFAVHPDESFKTVGSLARVVLAHNLARLSERFGMRDPADVWNAIQLIIVEFTGVSPESVTRDSRFVEDLGMG